MANAKSKKRTYRSLREYRRAFFPSGHRETTGSVDPFATGLEMAKKFNFEYANFYAAMAYPGSQLYNDAIKQGIKLPEEWYGFSQYAEETLPMPTKYLSAADVLRFRDHAFKEYFTNPGYLEMIRGKFGPEVVKHIKEITKHEIHRKILVLER